MAPGIEEVVLVGEPLPDPQTEVGQLHPAGIAAEAGRPGPGEAVVDAVDGEAVQMLVAPAERDLQHRV